VKHHGAPPALPWMEGEVARTYRSFRLIAAFTLQGGCPFRPSTIPVAPPMPDHPSQAARLSATASASSRLAQQRSEHVDKATILLFRHGIIVLHRLPVGFQ
jgi:hypothetical protein